MGEFRGHAPATFRRPMRAGAVRGLLAALEALQAPDRQRSAAENLAELEQRRRDAEDQARRQGELRLA